MTSRQSPCILVASAAKRDRPTSLREIIVAWPEVSPRDRSFFRTVDVILLSALCAWIVWRALWMTYPASNQRGGVSNLVWFLILTSGPFLAAGLSIIAMIRRDDQKLWIKLFSGALVIICLILVWLATLDDIMEAYSVSAMPLLVIWILLIAKLIVGLFTLIAPDKTDFGERKCNLHRLIVASVVGPLVGMLVWSALNIPLVAWRAHAVAGSDAYCLQVPARGWRSDITLRDPLLDEVAITRWGQLAGLAMQAPFEPRGRTGEKFQDQNHSILTVKRGSKIEEYHWSYFAFDFLPGAKSTYAQCEPRDDFFSTVHWS